MKKTYLTTSEILVQLSNPDVVLLDVRPIAAFNGWKLQGELRGGHIPGATSFPVSWMGSLSGDGQRALLAAKGIKAGKKVIIYGYQSEESQVMIGLLKGLGFVEVLVYEDRLAEWAAEATLPMSQLTNYRQLVHAAWLYQLISGEQPEAGPEREHLLFEVGWGGLKDYETGHIPGAFYLDTTTIEKEPLWNVVDDSALAKLLLSKGINGEKTILLYGRDPMAAARVAVVLMYAGVSDVRLLDGGYAAWTRAGYPVESGTNKPSPAGQWGQTGRQTGRQSFPGRPDYIVDTAEVKALLADEAAVLVSVRSWAEYTGRMSGYPFIQALGRIAGAVWGQAGSDPQHMEAYRNGDNTMRNYHEIAAFWRAMGIIPDNKVIFSCGTGWRAAEAFFCAYLMGWPRIAVYDGGWFEWSLDKSNPVEVGEPR